MTDHSNTRMNNNNNSKEKQQIVDPRCKVFVSRIPHHFTEDSVRDLLETSVQQPGSVVNVGLKYLQEEEDGDKDDAQHDKKSSAKQHQGYAFLQFQTPEQAATAVQLAQVRGGAKETSTKKYTLYIRAVEQDTENGNGNDDNNKRPHICFLWQSHKCPYGDACKFAHQGDGGCLETTPKTGNASDNHNKKRKRCWDYRKGKCQLGDDCPYSHDFDNSKQHLSATAPDRPKSEKDCINWKTKGECKKRDKCPYRHDETVRENARVKLENKKKESRESKNQDKGSKQQQPLSVRVFGLNYETTQADVCLFFEKCGKISNVTFPTFEDSGRSKGYCEVSFSSPKAVAAAVELNESELHGRWLSIQAGKMYLDHWENHGPSSKKRRRR